MDWEGCSVHRWLVVFWTGLVDWTHRLTAASRDRQGAMSLRTPSHNHNTFIPSFRVFVLYHSSSVIVINSRRSRLHVSFVTVCQYDWSSKKKDALKKGSGPILLSPFLSWRLSRLSPYRSGWHTYSGAAARWDCDLCAELCLFIPC